MRAVQVGEFGGPEVLKIVDLEPGVPGADELLVEVAFAGVNFRDLLHRKGSFGATLPYIPGTEGSGRVIAVGSGVVDFHAGERVVWKMGSSYAERVVVKAIESVAIPTAIDDATAAATLLQGLTAHALSSSVAPISSGEVALVHAAAGGVGSMLTQMLKARGAQVIASVSSEEKATVARSLGADHVVLASTDIAAAVRELTNGHGVEVVFDGVGPDTFEASLASCHTRGALVIYGASSGSLPPVDVMRLMAAGSVSLHRPSIRDYTLTRAELDQRAEQLFEWLANGQVKVLEGGRFDLDHAAVAHKQLENRHSIGKLLVQI